MATTGMTTPIATFAPVESPPSSPGEGVLVSEFVGSLLVGFVVPPVVVAVGLSVSVF